MGKRIRFYAEFIWRCSKYWWVFFRMLGAIFGVMTLYQLCPEFIWNADTGGVNVNSFKGFDFLFFCCRIPIALTY